MDMKVLYIDVFFALNLTLDYLLLILTAKLSGVPVLRWRALLSGGVGALLAILLFFVPCNIPVALLLKSGVGWLMVLLAFGIQERKKRLRLTGVLLVQAFLFAGAMYWLQSLGVGRIDLQNGVAYFQVSGRQIVLCAVIAFFAVQFIFSDRALKLEKRRLPLTVTLDGRTVSTSVLVDSGNLLREPVSGQPVVLLAPLVAAALFPPEIGAVLRQGTGWEPLALFQQLVERTDTKARLIPLHTAQNRQGIIIAVKPTSIIVKTGEREDYWIGISPADIDVCGGCRGLIGV